MPFHNLNPNLILGYHGCDRSVGEGLLAGNSFKHSQNDYDWLGTGVYFWESNPQRAYSFACDQVKRRKIQEPFVVGAVLSLGNCIDTMSERSLEAIERAYSSLKELFTSEGKELPANGGGPDLLLRKLDCAVINLLVTHLNQAGKEIVVDSVRASYHEGGQLYPGSGFTKKSHVQISIRSLTCIKGVFRLKESDYKS